MRRTRYCQIRGFLSEDSFRRLMDRMFDVCPRFTLTYHPSQKGHPLSVALSAHRVYSWTVLDWPGTEVFHVSAARILEKYICSDESRSVFLSHVNRIDELMFPENPEDLAFLNRWGRPCFFSISHERFWGFNMSVEPSEDIVKKEDWLELDCYELDDVKPVYY